MRPCVLTLGQVKETTFDIDGAKLRFVSFLACLFYGNLTSAQEHWSCHWSPRRPAAPVDKLYSSLRRSCKVRPCLQNAFQLNILYTYIKLLWICEQGFSICISWFAAAFFTKRVQFAAASSEPSAMRSMKMERSSHTLTASVIFCSLRLASQLNSA